MDIVINDTNIFLDLYDIGLLDTFFRLPIRVHTVDFVVNEISRPNQAQAIQQLIDNGMLVVKDYPALIMFNAEEDINPETGHFLFDNFFDAFYWAACTLTTVGYGDLYPISDVGRVISIISSMVGIAIIALPSGIITAGYMDEIRERKEPRYTDEDNLNVRE